MLSLTVLAWCFLFSAHVVLLLQMYQLSEGMSSSFINFISSLFDFELYYLSKVKQISAVCYHILPVFLLTISGCPFFFLIERKLIVVLFVLFLSWQHHMDVGSVGECLWAHTHLSLAYRCSLHVYS